MKFPHLRFCSFQGDQCLGFFSFSLLSDGACVNECPQDTFGDVRGWRCQPCHASCLTCHGPGARDCDRCIGWNRPIYGTCPVLSCPEGQYFDSKCNKSTQLFQLCRPQYFCASRAGMTLLNKYDGEMKQNLTRSIFFIGAIYYTLAGIIY